MAATLGADVPVCLSRVPARMAGIGDILTPVPRIPPFGMVLVNPGIAVATPSVFKARTGDFSSPAVLPQAWAGVPDLIAWLRDTRNDLEPPARLLAPVIGDVLASLAADDRCLLARMSGSGATCFGLYESPATAEAAAAALVHPRWWVWGGAACGSAPAASQSLVQAANQGTRVGSLCDIEQIAARAVVAEAGRKSARARSPKPVRNSTGPLHAVQDVTSPGTVKHFPGCRLRLTMSKIPQAEVSGTLATTL